MVTADSNPAVAIIEIYYDSNLSPPTNAGSYAIDATVVDPNYKGSAAGMLVINKADQTITFGALSNKTMGDASFTVSASASSGLAVSFSSLTSSVCTVDGNTITLLAAGTCTIRASQPGDNNYNAATDVDQFFTVNSASQTITVTTAAPSTATYNTSFTVAATASSGLSVAITVSGSCTGSGPGSATITMNSGTGTCTVYYNQAGNGTYGAATAVTSDTTAQKADQAVTFGSLSDKTMGDAPFTITATAASGLDVSFSSLTTSVCTITGNTVTLDAAGTCTIRASQSGDSNYNVADDVDQSFAVLPQL
jgi:hypothetical protein